MNYSNEFKEALKFAEKENIYLGSGNPNGKILMIGKEHYFDHKEEINSDAFYEEILQFRKNDIENNLNSWKNNIETAFIPEWNPNLNIEIINNNSFTIHWNQKNKNNRIINNQGNGGTSNTYINYQKIYQNIFSERVKEVNINFQKEFFLSELNDLPSKKSFNLIKLNEFRNQFINKRKDLFKKDFFKSFPVVIIAAGHYPVDFNFNIEEIFDVKWIGETTKVGNAWYNIHFNEDKTRILIHTRQLSTSVSNDLIEAISVKISNFLLS